MSKTETTLVQNSVSKIGLFASLMWTVFWFIVTANATDVAVSNYGGAFVAIGLLVFVACLVAIIVTGNAIKARNTAALESLASSNRPFRPF